MLSIKKLQNIFVILLILTGLRSSILPFALTLGKDHNLSLVKQSGETYLVLGHNHTKHSHFHRHNHDGNEISSNHHHDHFIKLPNSEPNVLMTINQSKIFDHLIKFFSQTSEIYPNLLGLLSQSYFDSIPERCRIPHCNQNIAKLKNIVKFLV